MPRISALSSTEAERRALLLQLRHDCALRIPQMAEIAGLTESTIYARERTTHTTIPWPPEQARSAARRMAEHFAQCAARCRRAESLLP